jgi:ATP-binding cassette subfamily F protein 3
MALITAEKLSRLYGTHAVLRDAAFTIDDSARIGLVGPNGCGKTTLLRILAGEDEPTEGRLQRRGDLRIGYLPQDPPALTGATVHEAMLSVFDDLAEMERQIAELAGRLDSADGPQAKRYAALQHEFEDRGGYEYRRRVEEVLGGLGFARRMWSQPLSELSGGQRTRAYLARLLLAGPHLLLLDEPTNHLDTEAVEWLERFCAGYAGAIVVVSHDRYFLDRVTQQTWELDFANLECYRGSYSAFLPKREHRFQERMKTFRQQQEYIRKTEEFIRQHLAGQRTREAQGRRSRLERFLRDEAIPEPRRTPVMHLRLRPPQRSGETVLHAEGLDCGYEQGETVVSTEKLHLTRGRRVAVVGPNGSGKTTLLRTLLGELPPLSGRVRWGSGVHAGYLSQSHAELDPNATALEALLAGPAGMTLDAARSLLGSFHIAGDDQHKRIDQLSGGQRSRIGLARLAATGANLLLLDEPTNHLDIPSAEVFQEVLQTFPETVLMVSHDRYLIEAVATELWVVDAGTVEVVPGGWQAYLDWRARRGNENARPGRPSLGGGSKAATVPADPPKPSGDAAEAHRLRRREQNRRKNLQRRCEELEKQIHETEAEIERLSEAIDAAGGRGDVEEVTRLGEQYQRQSRHLEGLLAEWEQIGEEIESAG